VPVTHARLWNCSVALKSVPAIFQETNLNTAALTWSVKSDQLENYRQTLHHIRLYLGMRLFAISKENMRLIGIFLNKFGAGCDILNNAELIRDRAKRSNHHLMKLIGDESEKIDEERCWRLWSRLRAISGLFLTSLQNTWLSALQKISCNELWISCGSCS